MKLILRCGGNLRAGPERQMVDDYIKRAKTLAPTCGFLSVNEQEIDLRKQKTRARQTQKLLETIGPQTRTVLLDEHGKNLTSRQIAKQLEDFRESGYLETVFIIGGADGFEPSQLPAGSVKWSFGNQTWPHRLVRVMLAEQIYRGLSILAKTPYHRD